MPKSTRNAGHQDSSQINGGVTGANGGHYWRKGWVLLVQIEGVAGAKNFLSLPKASLLEEAKLSVLLVLPVLLTHRHFSGEVAVLENNLPLKEKNHAGGTHEPRYSKKRNHKP